MALSPGDRASPSVLEKTASVRSRLLSRPRELALCTKGALAAKHRQDADLQLKGRHVSWRSCAIVAISHTSLARSCYRRDGAGRCVFFLWPVGQPQTQTRLVFRARPEHGHCPRPGVVCHVAARGRRPQRPGATEARRHRGPTPRLGCGRIWAKKPAGLGYRGQKNIWVWTTVGKSHLGLGYHGQNLCGFGLLRAQNPRGFGLPWAKITWVWATMGKIYLGLGYYGHRTPAGLGKVTWVWVTMGKNNFGLGGWVVQLYRSIGTIIYEPY